MLQSYSEERSHPEDLLEAYALDALDPEEEARVDSHIDLCDRCQTELNRWQLTASMLGLAVEPEAAPSSLRARVLNGIPTPPRVRRSHYRRLIPQLPKISLGNWGVPVTATVVLVVLGSSIFLNMRVMSQVEEVTVQSATVTARLNEAITQNQQMRLVNETLETRLEQSEVLGIELIDGMRKMHALSYMSVHPDTLPVVLRPAGGEGEQQGMLLVGDGGQQALLMVANMVQSAVPTPYQVWLEKDGVRLSAGKLHVDASGWGTLNFTPPEPMFKYDSVNLTMPMADSTTPEQEQLVLTSRLPSAGLLR